MASFRNVAFLPLCLLSVLLLFSVGCKTGEAVLSPLELTVENKNLTLDTMKTCIKEAGIRRGWAVKDMGQGQAQATLNVRNHTVVVDIFYTPNDFKIVYRDSVNMDYTGASIHRNYNRWVKNLSEEIKIRAISL